MFPRWPLSAEIKVQTCSVFEKCLWCLRYSPALSQVRKQRRAQDFFLCFVSDVRRAAEALRAIGGESCAEEPQLSLKPPSVKSRDRHFLLKPALSLTFTPVYLKKDQSHHRNPQPPEDGLLASTSAWLDQRHHHHVKAWLEDFIWASRFAQSTSSETEKKLKWWNSLRAVTVSHLKLQKSEMRAIGWRTSTLVPAGSCRAKFNIPKFFSLLFTRGRPDMSVTFLTEAPPTASSPGSR